MTLPMRSSYAFRQMDKRNTCLSRAARTRICFSTEMEVRISSKMGMGENSAMVGRKQ